MGSVILDKHVLVTGGAGYIGSFLIGQLLHLGYLVTVIDDLLYGGESLLAYFANENFHFVKTNVSDPRTVQSSLRSDWPNPNAVVHLAAIVGFPACQSVGRFVAWRYNVESTQHVYEQAERLGAKRFIYLSSYSNYGISPDGKPATEETVLNPQSLYAETKVASERYLLAQSENSQCAPIVLRPATLYGLSPRPRFDLMVNQFVLDAYAKRRLMIYQRGYSRSFIHISDVVHGIILGLQLPIEKIGSQVYNIGSEQGNLNKEQVVELILKRLPETSVDYKDMTFGGDMRDITVSFEKARTELGFDAQFSVDDGVREVLQAIQKGIIPDPSDLRYRNARFIVQ